MSRIIAGNRTDQIFSFSGIPFVRLLKAFEIPKSGKKKKIVYTPPKTSEVKNGKNKTHG